MTMPEYIKIETAIKIVKEYTPILTQDCSSMKCVERSLRNAPTADVVEVRHGEWIYCPETINLRSHFYCSACNGIRLEHYTKNNFRYCPNCGAKMDRGD